MDKPTRPRTVCCGKPGLRVILVQCAPPSVVLYMPLPGPPLESPHGLRTACHIVAYISSGLPGSITRQIAPVSLSTNRIFFQDLPPSVDLKTPRLGSGANTCPIEAT